MDQINYSRLKKCMERAENGESLTVGFFGGSITQGSLASTEQNMYAYLVYQWWVKCFPDADIHYVNGGIGGTTSHFGTARAQQDLLKYQPDVVVIDFSVNDDANEFFQETYEGLLRKILSWKSKPAVILLNNVFYDTGENAQEYHNAVGMHYGVPFVSIRDTIYQQIKAGIYSRIELTPDGLHPNDKGHRLVADEIIRLLEQVRQMEVTEMKEKELPPAMTSNAYEHARRLTINDCSPELDGFRADAEEKKGILDFFKNGWIGKKAGDRIVFELDASCIAVQYRKTIHRPAMTAELVLDGDEDRKMVLDGNFEEDWGDCLYLEPILHHGEQKRHTVEIRMPEQEKAGEFYLLSLIIA